MRFQPVIPTMLTPVGVPVLPDPVAAFLCVAEALQPDLAQGFQSAPATLSSVAGPG